MHGLFCLFAEKVIVSEIGDNWFATFAPADLRTAFGGFFNGETVLLPNGTLTEKDSLKLRGRAASVGLLSVASETERRLAVRVGGLDESIVHAAGSPEYDVLADKNRRRILFMPSHRETLCRDEGVFDPDFAASAYCGTINELLCDERLFDAAEECGYDFDFAPHERTYLQISDFEMDEIVNIVPPNRARRILFEEASLLVTDCMPAFDMAYMMKPVIYFRFAEEEGLPCGCCFDTPSSFPDGARFGEIVESESLLVDRILSYMKNYCAESNAYARRAEAFFAYTDKNNRERIYALLRETTR